MAKCPKCGYEQAIYDDINAWWHCPQCHGSGEVQMTNEEWFCQLTTEEKAKFLRQIYRDGRDDYIGEWYEQTEADFVEWLKQPHTNE